MPQQGLPPSLMNSLASQEQEPTGPGLPPPDPTHRALMEQDHESLPDSGGPMGTIPPSGSTIGPAPPGWFERMLQNGFQVTDEIRGILKSAFDVYKGVVTAPIRAWEGVVEGKVAERENLPRSRHGEFGLTDKHESGPWPRIIR